MKMNRFANGLLIGGMATMAGAAYLAQNKRARNKIVKKGKKTVMKAEEVLDDMMDDLMMK